MLGESEFNFLSDLKTVDKGLVMLQRESKESATFFFPSLVSSKGIFVNLDKAV